MREVARLRLGHAHHGLEAFLPGDARELLAGVHPLAGLERERLQHALLPGAHGHRADALHLEARDRAQALDLGLAQPSCALSDSGEEREPLCLAVVALLRLGQVVAARDRSPCSR
jgi:hypothetical protein